MPDSFTCGGCGAQVTEPPGTPCPKCRSTHRTVSVEAKVTLPIGATVQAQAEVTTYPQSLLSFAKGLIDQGQFGIAVVVALMACEVATERSITEAIAAKGLQHLEPAIRRSLNGYSLNNDRVRKWYTTLTGDDIAKSAPFWSDFKSSAKRRNDIIHRGILPGKAEAEQSYKAAYDLVEHLKK